MQPPSSGPFAWVAPLAIMFAFATLLGLSGARAFAPHAHPEHRLEWDERTGWVTPPGASPVAYFRGEFVLDTAPPRAVLQVAATDYFKAYVNGVEVGGNELSMAITTGAYAVGAHLRPGRNVIAVTVLRKSYPGPAALRAEVRWDTTTGEVGRFFSGEHWRSTSVQEWQVGATLAWRDTDFVDRAWPFARRADRPELDAEQPVDVPAAVLLHVPRGEQLALPEGALRGAFRRQLELPRGTLDGVWLGIGGELAHDLAVNGWRVSGRGPLRDAMTLYDITQFLRPGQNDIEIGVGGESAGAHALISGVVRDGDAMHDFSAGPGWQATSGEVSAASAWVAPEFHGPWVAVLTSDGRVRGNPVVKVAGRAEFFKKALRADEQACLLTRDCPTTERWSRDIRWFAFSLVGTLGGLLAFALAFRSAPGGRVQASLEAYAIPLRVAALILLSALIATLDVRVDAGAVFRPGYFHALWMGVALWELLILAESWIARREEASA